MNKKFIERKRNKFFVNTSQTRVPREVTPLVGGQSLMPCPAETLFIFDVDANLTASKVDQVVPYPPAKRIFDFIVSGLLLILLLPLFLLIYLAILVNGLLIKQDYGPFLYWETRISQGKPFRFYKIRIFKTAALKRELAQKGFVFTKHVEKELTNLTVVGKFLKKFYLDELPQLFNVFLGQMSLVGTRPWNPIDYQREVNSGIFRKKILKAGITGLVQITKGTHRSYPGGDRALDDYYIAWCRRHNSWQILLFDLKILGLSLIKILRGQGL